MPSPHDLRQTLRQLADTARDVPDMPVTRPTRPHPAGRTRPVLLAATVLAVLLAIGLGASRTGLLSPGPAGPTRAVPVPTSPSSSTAETEPSPTATPRPAASGRAAAGATRPMTEAEVTTRTARCLPPLEAAKKHRRGELEVRYAQVQPVVGYPRDGEPRTALLLEDEAGYYDCSSADGLWVGKGGDDISRSPAAAGFELSTLSGGTTSRCGGAEAAATTGSVVVLKTSSATTRARVTVRGAGGSRTTSLPVRDGYLYVATQVSGRAAWRPATSTVELLDARGQTLSVQPDYGPVTRRLTTELAPCTRTDR